MIVDKKRLLYDRLHAKNLDHLFCNRIEHGMGCSPFVAEAICKVVKEVYFQAFSSSDNIKPGQLLFTCVSKANGATTAIKDAQQITVTLTLDGGEEDTAIRQKYGVDSLRRHRIARLCSETYDQDGLLTVEDLAYRLLNVGERTIHRDLALMRKQQINPPLRSTVKDIGRTVSHRAILVKNWLFGDELSDLERKYHHSLSAIENYINAFKRVVALQHQKHSIEQTAYLLKISCPLVETYRSIWRQFADKALPHRRKELLEALSIKRIKKTAVRRSA
jgi:hypothetical protein